MDFDYSRINDNPSPFYRVSIKAFVFDDNNRLLMGQALNGHWEPPGGGWEHGESIEECLNREFQEELGVEIESLSQIICAYRGINKRGFRSLKIAIRATLKSHDFKFGDLAGAKFVTKQELLNLPISTDEGGIKDCVDLIWPSTTLNKQR